MDGHSHATLDSATADVMTPAARIDRRAAAPRRAVYDRRAPVLIHPRYHAVFGDNS